ncbi:sugar transporter [Apiospora phragmitis]|uniref:Sugar transporter n=1 Tax=Apiospora phragmitis TaxID=2905665 RepID=A0ABR1X7C4_9PEZI
MEDGPESNEVVEKLVRAAFVARDAAIYDRVAQGDEEYANRPLQVTLEKEEKEALKNERDKLFSDRNILRVTAVVCLSAFLQGLMQASLNSSSLYPERLGAAGISNSNVSTDTNNSVAANSTLLPIAETWALGGLNAVPWFAAAGLGCWLAPPVNDHFGRKGAIAVSAALIMVSCVASGLIPLIMDENRRSDRWRVLFAVRIINGIGMGIKAVSTPILASETAIRFWRGSFLLAWQLWVACGLMVGLLLNLIFAATINNDDIVLGLMLGTPAVQAAMLLLVLWSCPESPRYYMRVGSKSYNPRRAYEELKKIRGKCEDIYLLHKTIEEEHSAQQIPERHPHTKEKPTRKRWTGGFLDLFTQKRLRNALISASTVALSQQLCGINVSAFYSGTLFTSFVEGNEKTQHITALGLSFGFAAAYAFPIPYSRSETNTDTVRLVATLLYLHAAVYAPGLGPIPFTLASESFPLSHRELGCASVISVNLFFAGLLSIFFPRLGLFSGLTLLAWVLVYFLVEETRELSLENLHDVFSVPKAQFIRLKHRRLRWLARRYLLRDTRAPEPAMEGVLVGGGSPSSFDGTRYALSTSGESIGGGGGGDMTGSRPGSAADPGGSLRSLHRDVPREYD